MTNDLIAGDRVTFTDRYGVTDSGTFHAYESFPNLRTGKDVVLAVVINTKGQHVALSPNKVKRRGHRA